MNEPLITSRKGNMKIINNVWVVYTNEGDYNRVISTHFNRKDARIFRNHYPVVVNQKGEDYKTHIGKLDNPKIVW
jgi:hypothetical protein